MRLFRLLPALLPLVPGIDDATGAAFELDPRRIVLTGPVNASTKEEANP